MQKRLSETLPNEIIIAIQRNDTSTVKTFIEKMDDVNMVDRYGATMLHWSVHKGNSDLAKFLLSKGADPDLKDKQGNTPISVAIINEDVDMIVLLSSKSKSSLEPR